MRRRNTPGYVKQIVNENISFFNFNKSFNKNINKALNDSGVHDIFDMYYLGEEKIKKFKGIGDKTLERINAALVESNYPTIDEYHNHCEQLKETPQYSKIFRHYALVLPIMSKETDGWMPFDHDRIMVVVGQRKYIFSQSTALAAWAFTPAERDSAKYTVKPKKDEVD